MFSILQLLSLYLLLISIGLLLPIKSKKIKIVISFIISLLFSIQLSSYYLTGNFINYQAISHMNLKAFSSFYQDFIFEIIAFAIFLVAFTFCTYKMSTILKQYITRQYTKIILCLLVIATFSLMTLPKGIVYELKNVYDITNVKEETFENALKKLNINPNEYIKPEDIHATKGKNIVVISIESLEQRFLSQEFNNLTPTLNRLSKEWTFYDVVPTPGCSWTSGSLYCYQTGLPSFFSGHGNAFFQGSNGTKLVGLGHILNKAGYNIKYIMGNIDFAGTSDLLKTYNIPYVSEKNTIGKYPKTHIGLNDYDLFNEAKLQINNFDKSKPFALFLSTINTHFPNGIYDKRMEKFISNKESNLEFSVAAVDFLINDFLTYLKNHNLLNNTVIYIFPDHNMMGRGKIIDRLAKKERKLYFLTNAAPNTLGRKTNEPLYQIEFPRLIINGSEIKTNAKFPLDHLKIKNINDYINKKRLDLTTLNTAGLKRTDLINGFSIKLSNNEIYIYNSKNNIVDKISLNNHIDTAFDITLSHDMRIISKNLINKNIGKLSQNYYDKRYNRVHLIIKIKNKNITKVYLGDKKLSGIIKKYNNKIYYSKKEIETILSSSKIKLINDVANKANDSNKLKLSPKEISLTSSEFITSKIVKSNLITGLDNKSQPLSRGLNVLSFENPKGKYSIEHFDTYGNVKELDKFLQKIRSLNKNRKFWVVVSHDAIRNHSKTDEISKLGLNKLAKLNGRVAYIAYKTPTGIEEYTSKKSVSIIIETPKDFKWK